MEKDKNILIIKKAIEYIEDEQKNRYNGYITSYQLLEDDLLKILKDYEK